MAPLCSGLIAAVLIACLPGTALPEHVALDDLPEEIVSGATPGRLVVDTPSAVIDMHLHAGRGTSQASWADIMEGLDRYNVVLAMLAVDDSSGVSWHERAPDRFWVGPAFPCYEGRFPKMDPCFEEDDGWPDLPWLRDEYESGRMRMMGELIYVYYGIPPTDERLDPYFALAEELDIPVGVHVGRGPPARAREPGCCPHFDDDLGDPALLEPVLERHPDLRIWLMHVPGWDYVDETIALLRAYPNVYAEMSVVNSVLPAVAHEAVLREVVEAGVIDRIMIGSDNMPLGPIIERIEAVPFLSEDQRRGIYCENAARFLRLEDEACTADRKETP